MGEHIYGQIFYYEEDKSIEDPVALTQFYREELQLHGMTNPSVLYEMSLIEGGFGVLNEFPPAMNVSWSYLVQAAELGHPAALHKLASAYFTGIYGAYSVPIDIGRSLVLDQMAAIQGYFPAHLSLGYKHLKGIGVKQSCERALLHYEYAANTVVNNYQKRGYGVQYERLHISQAEKKRKELAPEILEYYHQAAVEGDIAAATNLGNIYLQGIRIAPQNISLALYYYKLGYDWGGVAASGLLGYTLVQLEIANKLYSTNQELIDLYGSQTKLFLKYAVVRGDVNAGVGIGTISPDNITFSLNYATQA